MDSDQDLPFESELFGAPRSNSAVMFRTSWLHRSAGLGAIRVTSTNQGIQHLWVEAENTTRHPTFESRFTASNTDYWLKMIEGEYVTEIVFRKSESRDRISAVRFVTNMRQSQWYGSAHGTLRTITAPLGFYIHMVQGSNENGILRNVGAYFIPHSLRDDEHTSSKWLADSAVIGDVAYNSTSDKCAWSGVGIIQAIVVRVSIHLAQVGILSPTKYRRLLAVTEHPLGQGEHVFVLAEHECITALRAYLSNGRVCAIQFGATHRTSEWFGPVPSADAVVESRSVHDVPQATHIGGIFTMKGDDDIKSIGVGFYKKLA